MARRTRNQDPTSDKALVIQETLESEGWQYVTNEFARTAKSLRTKILYGSDPSEVMTQVGNLRYLKTTLDAVYALAAIDTPPHIAALFE